MARKDHLLTIQSDSKLSKKFLSRNNVIAFQAQQPTIAQQINGIGAASKTPDEVKDTKFPVLNPIDEIGKNLTAALNIDLSLENSPFHCLELSDVGATVATLTVNLINLVKNKAEKFILDITKDPANTIDPTITFVPTIENLPAGFPTNDPRYLLEVVARETPSETRFEVVNRLSGGGGSQTPWTQDIDADGFDLQDLSNIEFRDTTGAPAGTVRTMYATPTQMRWNVPTGDTFEWSQNNTTLMELSGTRLRVNAGKIAFGTSTLPSIQVGSGSGNLIFQIDAATDVYTFGINTVNQIQIEDGAIVPSLDNDIDLGKTTLEFKDLFIDGTANIDLLSMGGNITMGGFDITGVAEIVSTSGNVDVGDSVTGFDAFFGRRIEFPNLLGVATAANREIISTTVGGINTIKMNLPLNEDFIITENNVTSPIAFHIDTSAGHLTLDNPLLAIRINTSSLFTITKPDAQPAAFTSSNGFTFNDILKILTPAGDSALEFDGIDGAPDIGRINTPVNVDFEYSAGGTNKMRFDASNNEFQFNADIVRIQERLNVKETAVTPPTPPAGQCTLFLFDDGGAEPNNTVRVKFDNGSVVTIATEV